MPSILSGNCSLDDLVSHDGNEEKFMLSSQPSPTRAESL